MNPWDWAVQKFSAGGLSPDDKDLFSNSKPEDVLNDIIAFEQTQRKSSKVRRASAKCRPLVDAIHEYGKTLDVFANTSSVIPSLWSSLRALILAARRYEEYFLKLVDMLERIGDVLPRYSTYATLFKCHKPLQKALESAYLQILHFLTRAISVFKAASGRMIVKAAWKSFDQEFQDSVTQLRHSRELVEDEAKLASMVQQVQEQEKAEEERHRAAESRKRIEKLESFARGQEQKEYRSWLNARTCLEERQLIEDDLFGGRCEWILQRKEVNTWIDEPDTQVFLLHGPPGCGKSYLYSKLLRKLEQDKPTAYFLFCGGDKQRVTFSALLRSWCIQIIDFYPQGLRLLDTIREKGGNPTATEREVVELFQLLLADVPPCFLSVDAIDECLDGERIFQRLAFVPKQFKIFVTSRTPVAIHRDLRRLHVAVQALEVQPDLSRSDIDHFISEIINDIEIPCSEQTRDQVRQRLSKCDGAFLWVRLMVKEINMQTSELEIIDCLRQLPHGLQNTYESIMARIQSLPSIQKLLAYKVFFWVTTTRRPVSVRELRVLLAVQATSDSFDERRLISDAENIIMEVCRGLIQYRGLEKKIFCTHFTVTEFLDEYLSQQHIHHEIMASYNARQFRSNDSLAAAVCLRYLSCQFIGGIPAPENHAEAMTLFKRSDPVLALLSYSVTHWFIHLDAVDNQDEEVPLLASHFLNQQVPNRKFWWRLFWFSNPESVESVICPSSFSELHTVAYLGLPRMTTRMLPRVHPPAVDSVGRSPLWWATSRGHAEVSDILIAAGFDPDARDLDGVSCAHRAAASGHVEVFKVIMSHAELAKPVVTDEEGWTPLHWAVSRGQLALTQMILNSRYDQYGTRTHACKSGRVPLHLAALNGFTDYISALCTTKNDLVNQRDSQGYTALHLAAIQGHQHIIRELLRLGADPSLLDKSNRTAAQKAHAMGHEDVHLLLTSVTQFSEEISLRKESSLQMIGRKVVEYEMEDFVSTHARIHSIDTQDTSTLRAMVNGQLSVMNRLLGKGRFFRAQSDRRGRTALHHCVALGYTSIVRKMMNVKIFRGLGNEGIGGYINRQDERGWTALHYAAAGQFSTICKILLTHGAAASLKSREGNTAFDLAIAERHRETIEVLARYVPLSSDEISEEFAWSSVHISARNGTLSRAEIGGANVQDLQMPDAFGRTPLFRAVEMDKQEVAESICQRIHPEVNELLELSDVANSNEGADLLHFFLGLLPKDSLAKASQHRGTAQRLFMKMIKRKGITAIATLLQAGVDINSTDPSDVHSELTPLSYAINESHSDVAIFLIRHGANVFAKDLRGYPCLHRACSNLLHDVVECLLEHGADPTQAIQALMPISKKVDTPLYATIRGNIAGSRYRVSIAIARMLIKHGASLQATYHDSMKPAVWVAVHEMRYCTDAKQWSELREFLEENKCGVLLQECDLHGLVPIHKAAVENDDVTLKEQLDAGVPAYWLSFGPIVRSPLQLAIIHNSIDAAKILCQSGADLEEAISKRSNRLWNFADHDTRKVKEDIVTDLLEEVGRSYGHSQNPIHERTRDSLDAWRSLALATL